MNRYFFASDDTDTSLRLTEVELIRSFMEENFNPKDPVLKNKLKMFLDIHAHSAQRDIFIFAPNTANQEDMVKVKNFPTILNGISPYFSIDNCKFGNEKYKKNCARLAVFRDFNIFHSYTIESSCWGYSIPYSDDTAQFRDIDFLAFGKHLARGIARQFSIHVSEKDITPVPCPGLDIKMDFNLKEEEYSQELKQKVKVAKKKPKVI